MGLRIVSDLDEWHRWQQRRHLARQLKHQVLGARSSEPHATVVYGSADADIVVLVDAIHASMANAVLAPLRFLPPERVIRVFGPGVQQSGEPGLTQVVRVYDLGAHLRSAKTLLGCGEYTATGAAAWRWARAVGAASFVSQHGALTPHAPPLPRDSTLLAWSVSDGEFWRSGRTDVQHLAVGSQLLWAAGNAPGVDRTVRVSRQITYLGQGHAAEIPRRRMVEAALLFCREHEAIYRPHPSERDRLSLMTLNAYQRAGITVDAGHVPLADLPNPVVSVFSTGILEAAARGRDAWVSFPRPPAWLEEFWERYGMHRLGSTPTPAPVRPDNEPALKIADIVSDAAS